MRANNRRRDRLRQSVVLGTWFADSKLLITNPSSDSRYGDSVMEVDYGVGVILAKLKQLKIHQNTLVFFSSDNGAEGIAGKNGRFN